MTPFVEYLNIAFKTPSDNHPKCLSENPATNACDQKLEETLSATLENTLLGPLSHFPPEPSSFSHFLGHPLLWKQLVPKIWAERNKTPAFGIKIN